MRHAYREMATLGMFALSTWIIILLAVFFHTVNAMNIRDTLEWPRLIGFYVLVGTTDLVICYSGCILALYLARRGSRLQVVLALAAGSAIVAVPCSLVLYAAYALFHSGRDPAVGVLTVYASGVANSLWAAAVVSYVLFLRLDRRCLVSAKDLEAAEHVVREEESPDSAGTLHESASTPKRLEGIGGEASGSEDAGQTGGDGHRHVGPNQEVEEHGRSNEPNRLLGKLPPTIGRNVVYVHVSGHYLEVVTTLGSALTLMRLSDAVSALGERGMQIHRSYWAAYDHMLRLRRQDHRMLLCLTEGHELPVSRPFLAAVRDVIRTVR